MLLLPLLPLSLLLLPTTLASSPPPLPSSPSLSPPPPHQLSYSLSSYSPSPAPPPSHDAPLLNDRRRRKPPTGRFLHLTDLHPDPYYREGASEDEACHFKSKSRKERKLRRGKEGGGRGLTDEEEEEGDEEVGEDEAGWGQVDVKKVKTDKPRTAGYWGLPVSDCDSPLTLLNSTFDWLAANFRDQVDFVVWTGDNARHDIDTRLPRSLPEIFSLNEYVLDRLRGAFGEEVTIVGSIGNNDIYPHNVMFPGPSRITQTLLTLYQSRGLIPEHQSHTFARGGYYSVSPSHPELHDKLLLVSLNTIYFYMRNTVVDGCPPYEEDLRSSLSSFLPANVSSPDEVPHPSSPAASLLFSSSLLSFSAAADLDPGTEQLLWLEQQLVLARARGMQVWLTGHVPPGTKGGGENWYEGCEAGYGRLVREFGGTVVGQLFGHMNVDHFTFLTPPSSPSSSVEALSPPPSSSFLARLLHPFSSLSSSFDNEDTLDPLSASLPDLLFSLYRSLPSIPSPSNKSKKRPKSNLDDYSVIHVNPSVVPTYAPAVRVWEYNVTETRGEGRPPSAALQEEEEENGEWSRWSRWWSWFRPVAKEEEEGGEEEKFATSPSRINQFLTPLAYTQYFLPDASYPTSPPSPFDNASSSVLKWQVEYTTLSASAVSARLLSANSSNPDPLLLPSALPSPLKEFLSSHSSRASPSPRARLSLRRLLLKLGLTPYTDFFADGRGLVISEWVRLARWLTAKEGGGREGGRWKGVRGRMGVGTGEI